MLIGLGLGVAFAAVANLVIAAAPQEQSGIASGISVTSRAIGMALGAPIATVPLSAQVSTTGLPLEMGYTVAFFLCAALGVLATLASTFIPVHDQ
jgi:predicted MFS family arabinose efflux permease